MEYRWVLARYTKNSEQAKKVMELANAGVGYHVINKDRGKTDDPIVAFKFMMTKPLPAYLEYASEYQADKLERLDKARNGMPNIADRRTLH